MIAGYIRPYITLPIRRKLAKIWWLINLVSAAADNLCVSINSVHQVHVSVDRYPLTKEKPRGTRLVTKLYKWCRLLTDTPRKCYRYSTDGSLLHCRHTTNAIATDCQSTDWPTVDWWLVNTLPYSYRHLTATRPIYRLTLGRYMDQQSADMSIDTSYETQDSDKIELQHMHVNYMQPSLPHFFFAHVDKAKGAT